MAVINFRIGVGVGSIPRRRSGGTPAPGTFYRLTETGDRRVTESGDARRTE